MWNMRRRHSSHSWKTPAAEASVKAASAPRSGRSEAQSLYGRRSEGYRASARPGKPIPTSTLCFQQVPQEELQGCSIATSQPRFSLSCLIPLWFPHSNLRLLYSSRSGVTCHPNPDAVGGALLRMLDQERKTNGGLTENHTCRDEIPTRMAYPTRWLGRPTASVVHPPDLSTLSRVACPMMGHHQSHDHKQAANRYSPK